MMNDYSTDRKDLRKVPEGKYRARAIEATLEQTQPSDPSKPVYRFVRVKLELVDEMNVQLQWPGWFGSDQEKNKKTIQTLRLLGWKGVDLSDLSIHDANDVEIEVVDDPRDKAVYSKVKWINPWRQTSLHQIQEFAERMKELCEAVGAEATPFEKKSKSYAKTPTIREEEVAKFANPALAAEFDDIPF